MKNRLRNIVSNIVRTGAIVRVIFSLSPHISRWECFKGFVTGRYTLSSDWKIQWVSTRNW